MLITVSGIGGSGKSTCVKQLADQFNSHDMKPICLRFQRLKCFLFLQKAFYNNVLKGNYSDNILKEHSDKEQCNVDSIYNYRTLNIYLMLGYTLRILLFWLYYLVFLRNKLIVLDRYFYDNLVHFHIKKKSERIYFYLIKKIVPKPDLAILMNTNYKIIKIRRPHRSLQYITLLSKSYQKKCEQFSNVTIICSDDMGHMENNIRKLIQRFLNQISIK